jgi:small subunit ribosomal protein S11
MTEEKDKKEEIKKVPEIKESEDKSENFAVETEKDEKAEILAKKKKEKKIKRQILKGRASVKCSYNNTMVSISDTSGNILGWSTSGLLGFKGAKKATPYAATQVVGTVSEKVRKYGIKELEVYVKGVGSGREASIRALANNGFDLILIKDITPIPHNGCRPKKPRRV